MSERMQKIQIRQIDPGDAGAWRALRQALWPEDDHLEEVRAFFRGELLEPESVLVAEAEDAERTIVAFAELSIRREVPGSRGVRVGYVEGLYVLPAWRNRGVAR